jgi:hypothetical protein
MQLEAQPTGIGGNRKAVDSARDTARCFTTGHGSGSRPTPALHIHSETFPALRKLHDCSRRQRAAGSD